MTAHVAPLRREGVAAGLVWTTVAHLAIVGLVVLASRSVQPMGTVYAVNLVAAPAPSETRRPIAEALPQPVERTAPIEQPSRTAPVPPAPTPTVPQPKREAAPQTASTATPIAGETPSTGSDVANVSTPGAEFPYPEYLRNIVNEIYRRWQRPAGPQSLRTEVSFLILRDGTVREIRVSGRSRSLSFDLSAQGAVEAAANARAFGPLPEGFRSDVLAIALSFQPRTTP